MRVFTAEGVVLRTYRLGEADLIVVFLTRDRGKKRGVARGARRPQSRFGGAFEPLTRTILTYAERERRDLARIRSADTLLSPLALRDPQALGHAAYFAELIDACAPEGDPNERLFRLAASVAEALVAGVPVGPLARYFEYWLLRLEGLYPGVAHCAACGEPFGDAGAILVPGALTLACRRCRPDEGAGVLQAAALAFLDAVSHLGPTHIRAVPLSAEAERELETVHQLLLEAHLERAPKSLRVLRELKAVADLS